MSRPSDVPVSPLLGAHMSIAGGLVRAIERGTEVGCEVIQIFTKNSNQWGAKPIEPDEAFQFQERIKASGIRFAFAHDSYLINLASPDPLLLEKSRRAFAEEVRRAEILGLRSLVLHPGAHLGSGEKEGIQRISESFNTVFTETADCKVQVLIETTAGQGTHLGFRFEQIRQMFEGVRAPERLGVCVDTCHLLAAGYDFRTPQGYEATFKEFDRVVGISRIKAFHLNDSKKGLGSRVDRHEHIGKGHIGQGPFGWILNDPRFQGLPMALETPKGKDDAWDRENLGLLKSLLGKKQ